MKEQVLNTISKAKKLANMLYQAHTNCLKRAEFFQLLICKKIAGIIFV